jgi:hypothetical protein
LELSDAKRDQKNDTAQVSPPPLAIGAAGKPPAAGPLVNAKTVTYQDIAGDTVTVALSNSLLAAANVNSVFLFTFGSVNGDNSGLSEH